MPCAYGLAVFDGKSASQVVYGVLNYRALAKKMRGKRWKNDAAREADQLAFTVLAADDAPVVNVGEPKAADRQALADLGSAMRSGRAYARAGVLLEQITPASGDIYTAALMYRFDFERIRKDSAAAVRAAEELAERQPAHADYWRAEAAKLVRFS